MNWRVLRRAAFLLATTVALGIPGFADSISVTIKISGPRSCQVNGSFQVDVSSAVAWSVLTDYPHLPNFVPGMKKSEVIEKTNDSLLLYQVALGKFLFFSRSIHVLLEVKERPNDVISFKDIGHDDFLIYRGWWRISGAPPSLIVAYNLESSRKFPMPRVIARAIFKKNAERLLAGVRNEMLRRK